MGPSGGARAASVLGPQSHFPTSVLGTGAWPRPSSKDSSGSHRRVVHPRGSSSCTRKGGSRRSKLQEEEGCCGTWGIQTQREVVIPCTEHLPCAVSDSVGLDRARGD